MKNIKFQSMTAALEPHFDKHLNELPPELEVRVKECFFPLSWGALDFNQRRSITLQWDMQHDPALEEENQYWFNLSCDIDQVDREIDEWESMHHRGIPSEAQIKEEKLIELRGNLAGLKKRWSLPPFWEPDSKKIESLPKNSITPKAKHDAPATSETQTAPATETARIPGKMPSRAVSKLAVQAAWEIECESKQRATDREVMTRLQQWADNGDKADVLKKSDIPNRGVYWLTGKYKENFYSLEACQKTLKTWGESRE